MVEHPPLPLFRLFPSVDLEFMKMQKRFLAIQKADRDQRDRALKQYKEFGYAELEIEVTDDEEDEGRGFAGMVAGEGLKTVAK